jgi:hypothetical protein
MRSNCNKFILFTVFNFLLVMPASAHHSCAMYDTSKVYNLTGVVTRILPNTSHLEIYMVPLNEARDTIIRDESGEPMEWAIEMYGSAQATLDGISVNGFPRGSIISIGINPLRSGRPAGFRGDSGLFKCPANTPPAPGMHCDTVEGSTSHGEGIMEQATGPAPGL